MQLQYIKDDRKYVSLQLVIFFLFHLLLLPLYHNPHILLRNRLVPLDHILPFHMLSPTQSILQHVLVSIKRILRSSYHLVLASTIPFKFSMLLQSLKFRA